MRRASRLVVGLFLVGLAFIASPPAAHACSCMQATEAEHTNFADVVFDGAATKMTVDDNQYIWTFTVDRLVKGDAANPQKVTTNNNSAACGDSFAVGKTYRIFTNRSEGGGLNTGLCSGNHEVAAVTPTTAPPTPTSTTAKPTTTVPRQTTTVMPTTTSTPEPSTTNLSSGAVVTNAGDVAINETSDGGGGNGPLVAGGVIAAAGALTATGYALYRRRTL